jgi:polyisoprenoid-binding protein YceI
MLLVLISSISQAAPTTNAYKILPAESSIKFEAEQSGQPVKGEFKTFAADIKFSPDALERSHAKITIEMGSFIIDDMMAKSELKQSAWLDIKAFPQAIFETESFKALGDNKYEAAANLTIKGKKQPVKLLFTLNEFSKENAYMTGETTLKRTVFGIGENDTESVKDDVKVYVVVKAIGITN